jgi:hypothetical protein
LWRPPRRRGLIGGRSNGDGDRQPERGRGRHDRRKALAGERREADPGERERQDGDEPAPRRDGPHRCPGNRGEAEREPGEAGGVPPRGGERDGDEQDEGDGRPGDRDRHGQTDDDAVEPGQALIS